MACVSIVQNPQDIIPISDNICMMHSHISSKNMTQLYNNKQTVNFVLLFNLLLKKWLWK